MVQTIRVSHKNGGCVLVVREVRLMISGICKYNHWPEYC